MPESISNKSDTAEVASLQSVLTTNSNDLLVKLFSFDGQSSTVNDGGDECLASLEKSLLEKMQQKYESIMSEKFDKIKTRNTELEDMKEKIRLLEQRNAELEKIVTNKTSTSSANSSTANMSINFDALTAVTNCVETKNSSVDTVMPTFEQPAPMNSNVTFQQNMLNNMVNNMQLAKQSSDTTAMNPSIQQSLCNIPNINQGGYILTNNGLVYVPPMTNSAVALNVNDQSISVSPDSVNQFIAESAKESSFPTSVSAIQPLAQSAFMLPNGQFIPLTTTGLQAPPMTSAPKQRKQAAIKSKQSPLLPLISDTALLQQQNDLDLTKKHRAIRPKPSSVASFNSQPLNAGFIDYSAAQTLTLTTEDILSRATSMILSTDEFIKNNTIPQFNAACLQLTGQTDTTENAITTSTLNQKSDKSSKTASVKVLTNSKAYENTDLDLFVDTQKHESLKEPQTNEVFQENMMTTALDALNSNNAACADAESQLINFAQSYGINIQQTKKKRSKSPEVASMPSLEQFLGIENFSKNTEPSSQQGKRYSKKASSKTQPQSNGEHGNKIAPVNNNELNDFFDNIETSLLKNNASSATSTPMKGKKHLAFDSEKNLLNESNKNCQKKTLTNGTTTPKCDKKATNKVKNKENQMNLSSSSSSSQINTKLLNQNEFGYNDPGNMVDQSINQVVAGMDNFVTIGDLSDEFDNDGNYNQQNAPKHGSINTPKLIVNNRTNPAKSSFLSDDEDESVDKAKAESRNGTTVLGKAKKMNENKKRIPLKPDNKQIGIKKRGRPPKQKNPAEFERNNNQLLGINGLMNGDEIDNNSSGGDTSEDNSMLCTPTLGKKSRGRPKKLSQVNFLADFGLLNRVDDVVKESISNQNSQTEEFIVKSKNNKRESEIDTLISGDEQFITIASLARSPKRNREQSSSDRKSPHFDDGTNTIISDYKEEYLEQGNQNENKDENADDSEVIDQCDDNDVDSGDSEIDKTSVVSILSKKRKRGRKGKQNPSCKSKCKKPKETTKQPDCTFEYAGLTRFEQPFAVKTSNEEKLDDFDAYKQKNDELSSPSTLLVESTPIANDNIEKDNQKNDHDETTSLEKMLFNSEACNNQQDEYENDLNELTSPIHTDTLSAVNNTNREVEAKKGMTESAANDLNLQDQIENIHEHGQYNESNVENLNSANSNLLHPSQPNDYKNMLIESNMSNVSNNQQQSMQSAQTSYIASIDAYNSNNINSSNNANDNIMSSYSIPIQTHAPQYNSNNSLNADYWNGYSQNSNKHTGPTNIVTSIDTNISSVPHRPTSTTPPTTALPSLYPQLGYNVDHEKSNKLKRANSERYDHINQTSLFSSNNSNHDQLYSNHHLQQHTQQHYHSSYYNPQSYFAAAFPQAPPFPSQFNQTPTVHETKPNNSKSSSKSRDTIPNLNTNGAVTSSILGNDPFNPLNQLHSATNSYLNPYSNILNDFPLNPPLQVKNQLPPKAAPTTKSTSKPKKASSSATAPPPRPNFYEYLSNPANNFLPSPYANPIAGSKSMYPAMPNDFLLGPQAHAYNNTVQQNWNNSASYFPITPNVDTQNTQLLQQDYANTMKQFNAPYSQHHRTDNLSFRDTGHNNTLQQYPVNLLATSHFYQQ